jgi:hypothetical protein
VGDPVLFIGDLPLPHSLVKLAGSGRWLPPEPKNIRDTFKDEPDGPHFYGLSEMERESRSFWAMNAEEAQMWMTGVDCPVDPKSMVLIADLGTDRPVALDYGSSRTDPQVLYYGPAGWVKVALTFGALIKALGLGDSGS